MLLSRKRAAGAMFAAFALALAACRRRRRCSILKNPTSVAEVYVRCVQRQGSRSDDPAARR